MYFKLPVIRLTAVIACLLCISTKGIAQCDTISLAPDSLQWMFDDYQEAYGGYGYYNRQGELSMAKYNDTVYIGGSFSYVGKTTSMFAGINESNNNLYNYSTWPKANDAVRAAAPDGSGGWVIGGDFTRVGDSARSGMAHINSSGQVTAFKADIPSYSYLYTIVVQNGVVYMGGTFTQVNGVTRPYVAAVDLATGVLSTTWNPGANSYVYSLATDGTDIYVGGAFSTLGSSSRSRIGAVNISSGNVTSWNPGVNGTVKKILICNNRVYVCGGFGVAGGASRNCFASLDKTTGTASAFHPTVGSSGSGIFDMTLLGNCIYIVGDFDAAQGGLQRHGVLAIDTLTALVTSWNPNPDAHPQCIGNNGSKIILGGAFNHIGTIFRPSLAMIDTGTATLTSFDAGLDSSYFSKVYTVNSYGGNTFFGGYFFGIKGIYRHGLVAIDMKNNAILPSFNPIVRRTADQNRSINTLKVDNGILYIGGTFDSISGVARNGLASIDLTANNTLTSWNPLNISGTFDQIYNIEINGNYAYIAGYFYFVYNGNHRAVTRIHKTTGTIDTWAPTIINTGNPYVVDIKIANNKVYMAGELYNTSYYRCGMQSYDLSNSTETYFNFDGPLHQIQISGNKLFASGGFNNCNSTSRNGYAALNLANNQLLPWNPSIPTTLLSPKVIPYKDKMMLFGNFSTVNGLFRYCIAMVDTVNALPVPGWHPIGFDECKAIYFGDTLLISGSYNLTDMGSPGVRNILGYARFHMNNYSTPTVSINTTTDTVCAGTSVTINSTTSIPNASYEWVKNGNLQTGSSSTFTFTPVNNDTIKCNIIVPQNGCSLDAKATSNSIVFTVIANTTATSTLSASDDTVCSGTAVNYSISSNVVGGSYQWKVNSSNVGTNSSTYSYAPGNGDIVSCTVTKANGTCFSPASVMDDTTMTVITNTVPAINITASANPVCPVKSDTLTATTNITGGNYQWLKNGSTAGTNSNTYIYTPANNDVIECVINVPTTGCFSKNADTSTTITITYMTPVVPDIHIAIGTDTVLCIGSYFSFNSTETNGGSAPVYQWLRNGQPIVGATSTPYATNSLQDKDVVSLVMKSNATCPIPEYDTSNGITVHTKPVTSPSVTISAAPGTTISPGTQVTFIATPVDAGGTPSYQWLLNGNYVSGATSNIYITNTLADNDNVQVVVYSSDTCSNPDTALSSVTTIVVQGIGAVNNFEHIALYPNPTEGNFIVKGKSLSSPAGHDILYKVTDVMGRIVITGDIETQNGIFEKSIALPAYTPPGIYYFNIYIDTESKTLIFNVRK